MKNAKTMLRKILLIGAVLPTLIFMGCKQKPTGGKNEKFKITFSVAGTGGSLKAAYGETELSGTSGTLEVESGETVTFTAKPNSGYKVDRWTGLAESFKNTEVVKLTVKKNTNVKVKFVSSSAPQDPSVQKFTVTFGVDGQGGSLAVSIDGQVDNSGTVEVESGKIIVFKAKPDKGYEVESWTGGVEAAQSDSETTTLTVKKDTDVKVKFTKINLDETVKINFKVDGEGGSLLLGYNGKSHLVSPVHVKKGSDISFAAIADAGFKIEKWTGLSPEKPDKQIVLVRNVKEDMDVTVKFVRE